MSAWDDPITHIRELEGKVSRIKALADQWEALDGEPATDRDLTVVNRSGRQLRAALEGR